MSSGNSVVGESEWKRKGGNDMFSHDFVPLCFCKAKNDPNRVFSVFIISFYCSIEL